MSLQEAFLDQATGYLRSLRQRIDSLGPAAEILTETHRRELEELVELTERAIKGEASQEAWRKAVESLTLDFLPLEQVLAIGLRKYIESLYQEPPLTVEEWRPYIGRDPARARRRYCHQARLALEGRVEPLLESVTNFQQLTGRDPARFLDRARALARQRRSSWFKKTPEAQARKLWQAVTDRPYPLDDAYNSFAGPLALCNSIARTLEMDRELRLPRSERTLQLLAIAIEEANFSEPLPEGFVSAEPSVLAPYPDEAGWRRLFAADPNAARRRFANLQLANAKMGTYQAFNLGESQAAFRAISQEMASN